MANTEKFISEIQQGYTCKGSAIVLGASILEGSVHKEAQVKVPLRTMNRHGLIAGATGTGKTKTLQTLSEQLSKAGTSVLLMDIKGDLSGIAAAGTLNDKINERSEKIGVPFNPAPNPVELMSLSGEPGVRLRATVSEFGPVLFSKILGLNETQTGVLGLVFKYCDDNQLALLDLKDLKKTLQYLSGEGAAAIEAEYGKISTVSVGAIMRNIVSLEQQGANTFLGEISFDVQDLCRLDENGHGTISVIRLTDIQDKPALFSTFMLSLLAEVYATFPERGDAEQPELVIFIDEAHLIFSEASKALLSQLETIIKLIRSKGVGIFFCTQSPDDVPESILGQLGLKVQHALRAFTAKDRKGIKLIAQNFPPSEYYDIETLLTGLGIGEALVSALSEKGNPTPLVHTMLRAPESRMDVLTDSEIQQIVNRSPLVKKYNREIDSESAYEILSEKLKEATEENHKDEMRKQEEKTEKGFFENMIDSTLTRQIGRTVAKEVTRGLLGVLGLGGKSRRKGLFG